MQFSVIACKSQFPPYLTALLPQDQIFDPEELEYDPVPEYVSEKKKIKTEPIDDGYKDSDNSGDAESLLQNIFN